MSAGGARLQRMPAPQYEYDGLLTSITLARDFDASPEFVFDAWIQPATAAQWLFSTTASTTVCDLDPRVGGTYTITRTQGDERYVAVGEYVVLDRPHQLVFTFGMPQFSADSCTVTVDISAQDGRTRLRLTQDRMRPGDEEAMLAGWSAMFDLLEQALTPDRDGRAA